MTQTELDTAFAAMAADDNDDMARLRYYERLADSELYLLLTAEPDGEDIDPETVDVEGLEYLLVFDRELRLAEFVGRSAPYVALSGRSLAAMIAGDELGLAVNIGVAGYEMLVPPAAISWLSETLGQGPEEGMARILEVRPPEGVPEHLLESLSRKLATGQGLAEFCFLAAVTYDDQTRGHVLAFVNVVDAAQHALAGAVNEALTFSGVEAGQLDVVFLADTDPNAAKFGQVGLRFDLPKPAERTVGQAPGMDPEKPPKLK